MLLTLLAISDYPRTAVFESRIPTRFVLERILAQATKVVHRFDEMTLWSSDIWDFLSTCAMTLMVFISWEAPPSTYLKENFDGGVCGDSRGVRLIIHGPNSKLIATNRSHLFEPTIPSAKLRATWASIAYAR